MPALDTNVLVRYVVQNDNGQLAAAKRLIGRCVAEGQALIVPVTVALGLEWVLRAGFIALAAEAGEQPLWRFDEGAAKGIGAQLLRTR